METDRIDRIVLVNKKEHLGNESSFCTEELGDNRGSIRDKECSGKPEW